MPLKVITPLAACHEIHSPSDFEKVFQVRYLQGLEFLNDKVQKKLQARYKKALKKEWITPRQKWLGAYYAPGLEGKIALDLTIRWIDGIIGYGVWTNREIPPHMYIGEYAGVLRRRRWWGRWDNLYCFDYAIGERRSSSFVIDAQDASNHTRFMNHSFDPNVEPISVDYRGQIHVIFRTKKKIAAGAQLCYDYGEEYWERRSKPAFLNLD